VVIGLEALVCLERRESDELDTLFAATKRSRKSKDDSAQK